MPFFTRLRGFSIGKKEDAHKTNTSVDLPPPTIEDSLQSNSEEIKEKLADLVKRFNLEEVQKEMEHIIDQSPKRKQSNPPPSTHNEDLEHIQCCIHHKDNHPFDFSKVDEELKIRALQVFNFADKDHSGAIDEGELFQLLIELVGNISRPESNRIYHEMDTNHSGHITFDEFLIGLVKYHWDTTAISPKLQRQSSLFQSSSENYEWEIHFPELEISEELGEGCYGTVFKGKWRGSRVAIKKLNRPPDSKVLEEFRNEVGILSKLRHPNLLLFMGASTSTKADLCIITEYMEGGNLHDLLHSKTKTYDLKTVLTWAKQTAFGVNYLHLERIIHRDLKPSNLLLDRYFNVKLCDFGLAIKMTGNQMKEGAGTPVWRAPEMLRGEPYDHSVDLYSFALCIWECLSRIKLTDDASFGHVETYSDLVNAIAVQHKRPSIPVFCPKEMRELIRICWSPEAKRRPNFGQVITMLESIGISMAMKASYITIELSSPLFTPKTLRK